MREESLALTWAQPGSKLEDALALRGLCTMTRKLAKIAIVLLPLLLGLGASLYWLYVNSEVSPPESLSFDLSLLGLMLVSALTVANLGLRWLRWHFLTRRFGARLRTRSSFQVYFSTLPLILTPLYCGEALRGLFFQRRDVRARGIGVKSWLIERCMDGSALLVWWLAGSGRHLAAGAMVLFALVMSIFVLSRIEKTAFAERSPGGAAATGLVLWLMTFVAWSLPILALWALLSIMGAPTAWPTVSLAFGASTMLGAFSGLPVGVGVSGSLGILLLQSGSTAGGVLPWAMAVFRLGTVWLAVGGGALLFWRWRRSLAEIYRGQLADDHFDEIASFYGDEIPDHVKDRLLSRKIELMRSALPTDGAQALKGLDLGCGQGWYVTQMAQEGFEMAGVDVSAGQVDNARRHSSAQGQSLDLKVATAAKIPFPDSSFDFVYSINVVHHILDDDARVSTFKEIARVLKPGGVFFLHEMNTVNPVFRLYMSYVFPLLNQIDEGNERWIMPDHLPAVKGASWETEVEYFTFVPDFAPKFLLKLLMPVERMLETGSWTRRMSAHFMASLRKQSS